MQWGHKVAFQFPAIMAVINAFDTMLNIKCIMAHPILEKMEWLQVINDVIFFTEQLKIREQCKFPTLEWCLLSLK